MKKRADNSLYTSQLNKFLLILGFDHSIRFINQSNLICREDSVLEQINNKIELRLNSVEDFFFHVFTHSQ